MDDAMAGEVLTGRGTCHECMLRALCRQQKSPGFGAVISCTITKICQVSTVCQGLFPITCSRNVPPCIFSSAEDSSSMWLASRRKRDLPSICERSPKCNALASALVNTTIWCSHFASVPSSFLKSNTSGHGSPPSGIEHWQSSYRNGHFSSLTVAPSSVAGPSPTHPRTPTSRR